MNEQEYKKMRDLEAVYWWHVGRRAIIGTILKKHLSMSSCQDKNRPLLLDLGCGTGGNADLLKNFGEVIGADSSPEAIKFAKNSGFSELVLVEEARLPFKNNTFDCVALLDVLEHIKNDEDILRECLRVLKLNGSLILTVPAYQWLFSGHDEALNHKRRYLMKNLIRQLSKAGFHISFKSYGITFLFPLMVLYRIIERIFKREQKASYLILPAFINNSFILLLKSESLLLKTGIKFPFGLSIIICAKKII